MAGFGLLLSLGGTIMSAMGQAQAAQAEADAAEANARAQEKRAMEERAVGSVKAERRTDESKKLQSEQLARFASSGGGLGGTASTVIAETEREGFQNNRYEIWGSEQKARGYEDEAAITRFAAAQKRKASGIAMGGSILSGVSKIGGEMTIPGGGSSFGGDYHYG